MPALSDGLGRRVRRVLSDPAEGIRTAPLCFPSRGFSKRRLAGAHASTTVASHDRAGLERLCRYVNRPPSASGRHPVTALPLDTITQEALCSAYIQG